MIIRPVFFSLVLVCVICLIGCGSSSSNAPETKSANKQTTDKPSTSPGPAGAKPVNLSNLFGKNFNASADKDAAQPKDENKDENKEDQDKQEKDKVMKLKPFVYVDKDGFGIEAFRMLIPEKWEVEGKVHWVMDNPGLPAVASFKIHSAKKQKQIEMFPAMAFFWTNNEGLLQMFPPGKKYMGSEVHQYCDAVTALKTIVIPRFRNNVANLKITQQKELPDVVKNLGANQQQPLPQGIQTSVNAGKVRIEYEEDGKEWEEEIFCVVESMSFQMQTMQGVVTNQNWGITYLFSFKAYKGKLDKQTVMFQTIANSFKINPQWFNYYTQFVEFLIQNQIKQINQIGEISKMISKMHNEISDGIMDSYNKRQAVYDKISTNFSNYIRGVEVYHSPYENKPVELPSGWEHVWMNKNGEVIMTNKPNFNPNEGDNRGWEQMKKKE